jgi:hypothetical protein
MKRIWWPEPVYEAKPYGAMTAGVLVAAVSFARAWSISVWDATFFVACLAGIAVAVYGGRILHTRFTYRSRSRWNVERSL